MKVTMIANEYPPYVYGGAGVHLKHLSEELSKLMEVEVRCFGDQDFSKDSLKVKGYKPWEKMKCEHEPRFTSALNTLSIDLLMVRDKIDSDIVHTHTWYASFAGFLAKILYQVPLVVTCHSLEPLRPWKEDQLGKAYRLSSWVEKNAIENADRVIAVSKMMKEDILRFFNISPEKVVVIHNGINLEKWVPTYTDATQKEYGIKKPYVFFVGRTTKQKGIDHLIDAADLIDKSAQIVICTSGADTKEFADEIKEKVKKKPNIVYIDILLKEEQYIELYTGSSVFVCPSIYEPFGIINLEAMACEVPVVASAVGGILETVVNNETGFLVEPGNPKQIAEKVNLLLKDTELAKKMGKSGRRRVEAYFSWRLIAEKTMELYESLL